MPILRLMTAALGGEENRCRMTDVATGFLQAVSAFMATRLGRSAHTAYKDTGALMDSLHDGVPDNTKPAFEQLKDDFEAAGELVEPITKAIKKQTDLIGKLADHAVTDAGIDPFTVALAGRIGVRVGTALLAMDEAVAIVARELAKDAQGNVDEATRTALMGIWNPWAQPFKDLGDGAGKVLDSLGEQLMDIDDASAELAKTVTFDRDAFRLAAALASTAQRDFGAVRLNQTRLEAFLGFKRREFSSPSEAEKAELVERDGKWWRADEAVFGLRIFTVIQPGLQNDPLIKKVMPGAKDPAPVKPTAVTLDSVDGLYLGDGQGDKNEKAVLPVQFNFPAVELRELALGIVRNPQKEVTGLELTSVIAGRLGSAVGMQVGGAGAVIALDGAPTDAAMFPWDVSPRWPDAIGLRIKAGPVTGGGYIERKVRKHGEQEIVEFGGTIQLEILKAGVFAVVILSPEPFSLVLVMGVRFPAPIELSFGFTFNGVGGLLALNRRVDTTELIAGMKSHILDRLLFPEDPIAEAPKLLDQVSKVFPYHDGGFVVGPIVELGWGSQAKIIEAKLGVILALPDPMVLILGAVRVRAPTKHTPLTDFRCEVYGEISGDRLLIVARLHDSKIAGITVSGDLGLLIQWGGGGDFALSVGGFHPDYKQAPKDLQALERLTMDLSPPAVVKIIIKAYFAVTAGAVMAGVRGDLKAELGPASAHAWLELDMIFRWVPRFGFEIDLGFGIDIEVFGHSFASVSFRGELKGTTPWRIEGLATVDVWFLPTFDLDIGPYTWGEDAPPLAPKADPLAVVAAALALEESWKAIMPHDGDLLVVLGPVEAPGMVAHPLAVLEISQSRLPLETHIDRVGSAAVTAHRVTMELAETAAGPVGAVATVSAPFSPGQFLALTGEKLLARSGFEQLPCGCRVSAATTPVHGTPRDGDVHWRTYFRKDEPEPQLLPFDPRLMNAVLVRHSLVDRALTERENPYLTRQERVNPSRTGKVTILPAGSATLHDADDGGRVLADLGVLSAGEAGRIMDAVNGSGAGHVAAVAIGVM